MDEDVFPVCARRLKEEGGLDSTADLIGHTRIHDLSMDQDTEFPSWRSWLRTNGITDVIATRDLKINNSAAVPHRGFLQPGISFDGHTARRET